MSEIRRLLRLAEKRNTAGEYTSTRFRVKRTLDASFRRACMEDSVTPNVVIEACLRGFVDRHPAVLAMIDQWIRDEGRERRDDRTGPKMTRSDIAEIYAAARSGLEDDRTCESCRGPMGDYGCDMCDDLED